MLACRASHIACDTSALVADSRRNPSRPPKPTGGKVAVLAAYGSAAAAWIHSCRVPTHSTRNEALSMGFHQTDAHKNGKGSYHQIGLVRGQFGGVHEGTWIQFLQ